MGLASLLRKMDRQQRAAFLLRYARRFGLAMEKRKAKNGSYRWVRKDKFHEDQQPKEDEATTLGQLGQRYPDEW